MPAPAHVPHLLRDWSCIAGVATLAILGECLIASAMHSLGDLDHLRRNSGLPGVVRTVLGCPRFLAGALFMALNFFAMLYTVSVVDLSLAAPAIAALNYIGNAVVAKLFLKENVDRRRWLAVSFVTVGVVLLSR